MWFSGGSDRVLRSYAIFLAALFAFLVLIACNLFIDDVPLLKTVVTTVAYIPLLIAVLWPTSNKSLQEETIQVRVLKFLWRASWLLFLAGYGTLMFAERIYRGAAKELALLDTTGGADEAIQALHARANELMSLLSGWVVFGLGTGFLVSVIYGFFWIKRNLAVSKNAGPPAVT
jgi:hypothetical protein